ncbi:MAG: TenA family protein [Carboxylicivirga sp.]|jgi:thiaminase/transcriptional activator TenA|nr:TenA family protein [Carboxylicivirga sp.]
MQFSEELWASISPIYKQLLEHDFVKGLTSGTLSSKAFAHYLTQDMLYIIDDSLALEKLALKTDYEEEEHFFQQMADEGIELERVLHREFLGYFKVRKATEKSPAIEAYTHFLLNHTEHSSYAVAACALLPCFWVYNAVGKHIVKLANDNNPYQMWIDTYKGDEFEVYVKRFIQIVEALSQHVSEAEKDAMKQAFVKATKYELAFFEEAVRL